MSLSPPVPLYETSLWSSTGLAEVEALMATLATGSRLDRLGLIVREHLDTGGKRLRARLALASLDALGHDRQVGIAWAAACELLHNATLVHDDLQDGDRVRRGHPTVWVRHGTAQAVNAGDVLLMLPFRAIEHLGAPEAVRWRLARALARGAEAVVRGQAAEMGLLGSRRLDWAAYEQAVRGKTAALFQLPVEGAALLAGRSVDTARELARAAGDLGIAFQIQDDILDLYGDKGRGAPGSDIAEGKVSALVVTHLARHPEHTEPLVALLELPRDGTPRAEIDAVIRLFAESGALAGAWDRLEAIRQRIRDDPALNGAPPLRSVVQNLFDIALKPIESAHP